MAKSKRILMISHHRLFKSWLRPGILARGLVENGHQVTMMVVAQNARFRFKRSHIDGIDVIEAPDLTSLTQRTRYSSASMYPPHRGLATSRRTLRHAFREEANRPLYAELSSCLGCRMGRSRTKPRTTL